ncbi:MAG: hypothetical protein PHD33_07445 [Atribacterota bacterium]|nr:hypothetical protein [Atribacterota bacterium]
MKKNFSLVILILLSVFIAMSLIACDSIDVIPTGIVTITLDIEPMTEIVGIDRSGKNYYIYMDDEFLFLGMITPLEALTIEEVPLGMHVFRATDQPPMMISSRSGMEKDLSEKISLICSGMLGHQVKEGINYVKIPVSCNLFIEIE